GVLTVQSGILSIGTINNASSSGVLGNSANAVVLGSSGTTGTLEYTGGTGSSTKTFTMATSGTGAFQIDTAGTTLTLSGVIVGSGTPGVNVTVGGDTTINVDRDRSAGSMTGNTFQFNNLSIGANTLNVTGANSYAVSFAGTTTLTGNAIFNPTTANLTLTGA